MDITAFFESFWGKIAVTLLVILIMALIYFFTGSKKTKKTDAKSVALTSMLTALAVAANNFLPHIPAPYGGSVTLFSMFFIFLIAYIYGARIGILAGIAFGLLDLIIHPMAYYPLQVVLDYALAFGMIGTGGILRNRKNGLISGYLLGVSGRFFCSFLSGVLFFAEYALEGFNGITWSFVYNISYIGIEAALTVAVLLIPAVRSAVEKLSDTFKTSSC